jgi:hypothetical protein
MPHFVIKRRRESDLQPSEYLLELVAPRTNAALISPAEHLMSACTSQVGGSSGSPVSLEIVGDGERSRFWVRTRTRSLRAEIRGSVAAAYPQSVVRSLDTGLLREGDPLRVDPQEQIASCAMVLRAGDHLPIRMFNDRDIASNAESAQADPVLGVLGALHDLPSGWRAVSQLLLIEPAPADWAKQFERLALENPATVERARGTASSGVAT